jgi:hypothetical protein
MQEVLGGGALKTVFLNGLLRTFYYFFTMHLGNNDIASEKQLAFYQLFYH